MAYLAYILARMYMYPRAGRGDCSCRLPLRAGHLAAIARKLHTTIPCWPSAHFWCAQWLRPPGGSATRANAETSVSSLTNCGEGLKSTTQDR
eukprot:SAG11_NODE_3110_length_2680_cov_1.724138_1_plen_92_part_00